MNERAGSSQNPRMNPFPGLRPFEFDEARLFFGREGQSQELLRRLIQNKFLAVVGTSGSGKSSLVRAGLLPALSWRSNIKEDWSWRVAVFRPGQDPIGSLAKALQTPGVLRDKGNLPSDSKDQDVALAMMETNLRRGSLGLVEAVKEARFQADERLLLVVDQFEELFTYQEEHKNTNTKADAEAFVRLLLEAAKHHAIYLVLTMRSDYLGDCAQFRDLPEALNNGQYLIPRMTRQQRRQAIEGPVGVGSGNIAPSLVQRLLNDVGDDPDQLPILQHALMRAWDEGESKEQNGIHIDLQIYKKIGELSHALNKHADDAFDELPDERSRKIAEKMFKCLTKKDSENRAVRRPSPVKTIAAVANAEPHEVIEVITKFQEEGRNFLTTPGSSNLDENSIIDISHESLIRNWSKLAGDDEHEGWVEEEDESKASFFRIVDAVRRKEKGEVGYWRDPDLAFGFKWKTENGPNQAWGELYEPGFSIHKVFTFLEESQKQQFEEHSAKEKLQRRAMLGLSIGFAVAVLFAVFAGWQWWRAEEQRAMANKARQISEQSRIEAENAKVKAKDALVLAEKARNEAENSKQEAIAERDRTKAAAEAEKVAKEQAIQQAKIARDQREEAQRLAQRVRAGVILSAASSQQSTDPTIGLLLLTELHSDEEPFINGVRETRDFVLPQVARGIMQGHTLPVTSAAFSQDGKRIVTASWDKTARVWQMGAQGVQGKPIVLRGHSSLVTYSTFSPDGKRVVTASSDQTARVWQVGAVGEPIVLEGHGGGVIHAAFSPDGQRVVSASQDKTARVWRVGASGVEGEPIVLEGHSGWVTHAAFSPDGQWVVTASDDNTARVWRIGGQEVKGVPIVLKGHNERVTFATFSPDGQWVVTASADKTARVWRVGWKEILTYLRSRITACLTVKQRLRYLEEESEEAKEKYEACERRYGRVPLVGL